MTEPLRTDPPNAGPLSDADREARIEQLLLSGLDHYFAGKYEQAINIWTRVAFLERGHGRARAYIERARGALAERQRASEELLHTGVAAYDAGDLETAHSLLTRAVEEGGPNETALVFLERLGRLQAAADAPRTDLIARAALAHELGVYGERGGTRWLVTIGMSVCVAAAILVSALPIASWLAEIPVDAPAVAPSSIEPLPTVRASETRIGRARELYSSGRLHEALRLLETVDTADPLRPEADRLRADVQRDLLARVAARPAAPSGESRP
jgi:tetratricopeptide (TPR) repeat protein